MSVIKWSTSSVGLDPLHAPTPTLALTAGKFNAGYTLETVLCYQACVERELTPWNDKQANLAGVSDPSIFSLPTHILWAISSLQASEVMDDGLTQGQYHQLLFRSAHSLPA